ncbi:MAG: DUF975 family protein [Oscillospiraceae bacterium]|nr:DUF975 family protein [Oscillospiraceae bacterium]
MELFRIIKGDAKRAVRFCGGRSTASAVTIILVCIFIAAAETVLTLIFAGISALPGNSEEIFYSPETAIIQAVISFLWITFVPPLLLGYAKLHLAFAEGKDESISLLFDMFSSAKKFFGSIVFSVMFMVRYAVLFSAAIVPGAALLWFAETVFTEENRSSEMLRIILGFLAVTIITFSVSLAIIFSLRWSLAAYYRAAGNGIHRSFVLSARATKGRHIEIISFRFSFIGWWIFSLLVIPLVWVLPYYSVANAIYANYLMEKYRRSFIEVPESIGDIQITETD